MWCARRSGMLAIVAACACLAMSSSAPAQIGKCCLPDGRGCRDVSQEQCDSAGGVFIAGQMCANPMDTCDTPLSGACCQAGVCDVRPQAQCPSGAPFFPNNPCAPTTCTGPVTGACCENFNCRITIAVDCSNGTFFAGQGCASNPCGTPPQGACCQGGLCSITVNSACIGPGLEWFAGMACLPNPCRLGACCASPTSCGVTTEPGCEQGNWLADGTCAPELCRIGGGACCVGGACVFTTEADCMIRGGVLSFSTPCDLVSCVPTTGACCNGTNCTVTAAGACAGAFQGAGSVCGDAGNPTTCCPANFNGAGGVSVQDIFDYLAAYFAGDPRADFNRSGETSVQDIFDFLVAYFAGC